MSRTMSIVGLMLVNERFYIWIHMQIRRSSVGQGTPTWIGWKDVAAKEGDACNTRRLAAELGGV